MAEPCQDVTQARPISAETPGRCCRNQPAKRRNRSFLAEARASAGPSPKAKSHVRGGDWPEMAPPGPDPADIAHMWSKKWAHYASAACTQTRNMARAHAGATAPTAERNPERRPDHTHPWTRARPPHTVKRRRGGPSEPGFGKQKPFATRVVGQKFESKNRLRRARCFTQRGQASGLTRRGFRNPQRRRRPPSAPELSGAGCEWVENVVGHFPVPFRCAATSAPARLPHACQAPYQRPFLRGQRPHVRPRY